MGEAKRRRLQSSSGNEVMPDGASPVYVGEINRTPVRFYVPQTTDDMVPWVSFDDLAHSVALGRADREDLRTAIITGAPGTVKRIRTERGFTEVVSGTIGPVAMSVLIEHKLATPADRDAFTNELMSAAQKSSPLLFDQDDNGGFLMGSSMAALFLGVGHEEILDRIAQSGIEPVEAPRSRPRH